MSKESAILIPAYILLCVAVMYDTLKRSFCSKSIFLLKNHILLIMWDFEFMSGQFSIENLFRSGLFSLFLLFTTMMMKEQHVVLK